MLPKYEWSSIPAEYHAGQASFPSHEECSVSCDDDLGIAPNGNVNQSTTASLPRSATFPQVITKKMPPSPDYGLLVPATALQAAEPIAFKETVASLNPEVAQKIDINEEAEENREEIRDEDEDEDEDEGEETKVKVPRKRIMTPAMRRKNTAISIMRRLINPNLRKRRPLTV
jgi:hypothetical protein